MNGSAVDLRWYCSGKAAQSDERRQGGAKYFLAMPRQSSVLICYAEKRHSSVAFGGGRVKFRKIKQWSSIAVRGSAMARHRHERRVRIRTAMAKESMGCSPNVERAGMTR